MLIFFFFFMFFINNSATCSVQATGSFLIAETIATFCILNLGMLLLLFMPEPWRKNSTLGNCRRKFSWKIDSIVSASIWYWHGNIALLEVKKVKSQGQGTLSRHTQTYSQLNSCSKSRKVTTKENLMMKLILCHCSKHSWSWFLLVYVCFIHLPLRTHPGPASHVRVRNMTSLQSKLSSQQAAFSGGGLCSSLITLHTVSTTAQEPPRLLGPYSWGSEQRLRISVAGGGGTMGWAGSHERMLIRKQGLWCQGPIITRSRAWMNMRQCSWIFDWVLSFSFNFLFHSFFFSLFQHCQIFSPCHSNLPFAFPLFFIFFCLCLSLLGTLRPLPQGVTSDPRSYLNLACPKDFWSLTQSFKNTRTLPKRSLTANSS